MRGRDAERLKDILDAIAAIENHLHGVICLTG